MRGACIDVIIKHVYILFILVFLRVACIVLVALASCSFRIQLQHVDTRHYHLLQATESPQAKAQALST